MRRGLILLILLALGLVLFIFTLRQVGVSGVVESLTLLSGPESILVFLALFLNQVVIASIKWRAIINSHKRGILKQPLQAGRPQVQKLNFWKIFLARWAGFSLSYLTPAAFFGGEPVRFLILRQETKLPPSRIISSIIVDKLISVLAGCCYFFTGIFFLLIYLDLSWLMEVIGLALLLAAILFLWFLLGQAKKLSFEKGLFTTMAERLYLNRLRMVKQNYDKLDEIEAGIRDFFKSSKKKLLKVFGWGIVEISFALLACWLIMSFAGFYLELPKLFAIRSMIDLSYIIPFPAALGTLEISQAFVFQVLGFSLAMGVAFSLIFRGLSLTLAFMGLLILGWLQVRFLGQRIINFFTSFGLPSRHPRGRGPEKK